MCNELEIYKKQLNSYKNLELSEKEFNPINVFFNFRIETELYLSLSANNLFLSSLSLTNSLHIFFNPTITF